MTGHASAILVAIGQGLLYVASGILMLVLLGGLAVQVWDWLVRLPPGARLELVKYRHGWTAHAITGDGEKIENLLRASGPAWEQRLRGARELRRRSVSAPPSPQRRVYTGPQPDDGGPKVSDEEWAELTRLLSQSDGDR